jgi:putative transposase
MDACPQRIIGWSIDTRQRTELVIDALGMAILRRRTARNSTILHSDHGTQYTSWEFGKRLRDAGLLGSTRSFQDRLAGWITIGSGTLRSDHERRGEPGNVTRPR